MQQFRHNLSTDAQRLRLKYTELNEVAQRPDWGVEQIILGLLTDTGDLSRKVLTRLGRRTGEATVQEVSHELCDCLWSLLVISDHFGIDLEKEFSDHIDSLLLRLESEICQTPAPRTDR